MDIRLSLAGDAAAAISIPFVVMLLGWIVTVIGRVRIARRQSELWGRLIDKVGPEGVASLLGEGRDGALEALLAGPDRPHARIISAAQGAIVVLVLGIALLASSFTAPHVPGVLGLLVSALGLGLAGAAGVGYWLSAKWNLLPRPNPLRPRRAE